MNREVLQKSNDSFLTKSKWELQELKNKLVLFENGDLVEKLLKNPNVSRLRKSIIDMNWKVIWKSAKAIFEYKNKSYLITKSEFSDGTKTNYLIQYNNNDDIVPQWEMDSMQIDAAQFIYKNEDYELYFMNEKIPINHIPQS